MRSTSICGICAMSFHFCARSHTPGEYSRNTLATCLRSRRPAAPAKTEVHLGNRGSSLEPALATLDAAGVAARVAAIGPGFSQFAAAIEELACDGAFLASLSPAELDETFEDIGVTARLQRRRVMFALGLGK